MKQKDLIKKINEKHWFHSIPIRRGIVTPGRVPLDYLSFLLKQIHFPTDLTGKTVLDIGAWDGFFSFEAEKRNAKRVVALDVHPKDRYGFEMARQLLDSKIEYVQDSIYQLSPERIGTFDIVLFLGVFYHLRYPLLALDRIREVTQEFCLLETHVVDHCWVTPIGEESLETAAPRVLRIPEVVGEAALLFDPFNPNDMAEKIYQVWTTLELQKRLVSKGKGQAKKFSAKKMAARHLEVFSLAVRSYRKRRYMCYKYVYEPLLKFKMYIKRRQIKGL